MRIWLVMFVAGMLGASVQVSFAGRKAYIGEGVYSCGAWTQERARDAKSQRAQLEKSWILGFVSGANIYGETEILSQLDAPTLYAWVDNYCRSKPLARVYDAALGMVDELLRRAPQTGH